MAPPPAFHDHHADAGWDAAVWLAMLALATAWYLWGVAAQRRRAKRWSRGRTAAWLIGIALVGVAVWPPVMARGHQDLRWHMGQHLLIGMFGPLALVLAAPMTLLLRTVPVRAGRAIVRVLRTPPVRVLSHPVTAMLLNIGAMGALYTTPLYAASLHTPALHHLVHAHFLAAGCLFCWAILAGPDPAPHAPGRGFRLGVLFVSIAVHGVLSKLMYAHLWPRNTHHPIEEIRGAARLMYYGGDLAELLLAVALFATWHGARRPLGRPAPAWRAPVGP